MHFKYTIGFILLLLVTKSYSRAATPEIYVDGGNTTASDDYYDDEDDEIDQPEEIDSFHTTISSFPISTTTTTTTTTSSIEKSTLRSQIIATELPKLNQKCPDQCNCTNNFKFIDCSNRNLDTIPSDIPNTAIMLNLSHNLLKEINDEDLCDYSNIQTLILTGNQIQTISEMAFKNLENLTHIELDRNLLTKIHPDIVVTAKQIKSMNLSYNQISISENIAFLNQNQLEELYLSNNNLNVIYDETFSNLTGLKLLNMDHNNFKEKINTKALAPLKQLNEMKLPANADNSDIKELCEILQSVDIIKFGESFEISCYEILADGGEKNISDKIKTVKKIDNVSSEFQNTQVENSSIVSTIKSSTMSISKSRGTKTIDDSKIMEVTTILNNLTSTLMDDNNNNINKTTTNPESIQTSSKEEDTYQVSVSRPIINHLLLAIIAIAVVGLLLGVVCRKDFCGIKTKLCRTRRPSETDQVRPAEEMPLNKVA